MLRLAGRREPAEMTADPPQQLVSLQQTAWGADIEKVQELGGGDPHARVRMRREALERGDRIRRQRASLRI
jgi:hypothetical protein